MSAIFKVCSCALSSGRTFLGVSIKSPLIALLLIHISMFLAELGFLQNLPKSNLITKFTFHFSFRHPRSGLLEFSVDYILLWSGFSNHVLKSYKHVFGRLGTQIFSRVSSIIVSIHGWLIFLRMLNGVSFPWMGAILRFLWSGWPEFFQSSKFYYSVVAYLGVFLELRKGVLSIV